MMAFERITSNKYVYLVKNKNKTTLAKTKRWACTEGEKGYVHYR